VGPGRSGLPSRRRVEGFAQLIAMSLSKPKRAGKRPWSETKSLRANIFPPGPTSAEEVGDWPSRLVESLQKGTDGSSDEAMLRLRTNLLRGVYVRSDYSGFECAQEALRCAVEALKSKLGWEFASKPIVFTQTCDVLPVPLEVLVAASVQLHNSETCVFNDLTSRLPVKAQKWIEAARPGTGDSKEDKVAAHRAIGEWLETNSAWIFGADTKCHCLVHGQACPVHRDAAPGPSSTEARAGTTGAGGSASASSSSAWSSPKAASSSSSTASTVPAMTGGKPDPLRVAVGGISCLPWTKTGLCEGHASACEVPHNVWLCERAELAVKLLEDLFFLECTPRYPIHLARQRLRNTHLVISIQDGPEYHGWPHKRLRLLAAGISTQTLEWLGPDSDKAIAKDYADKFHRAVKVAGDVLIASPREDELKEMVRLAAAQGYHVTAQELDTVDEDELLRMMFPPGGVQRFKEWMAKFSNQAEGSHTLLFDMDHHPDTRGTTAGEDRPVNLRHGTLIAAKRDQGGAVKWRLATGLDFLTAMGFHAFPQVAGQWGLSPMMPILSHLKNNQLHSLIGNGMHLVTQATWMVYVLSNVSKRHLEDIEHASSSRGKTSSMYRAGSWDDLS
jgi:hypothetical protein